MKNPPIPLAGDTRPLKFRLTLVLVLTCLAAAYLGFALLSFAYDKVLHFGVFFILTLELAYVFERPRPRLVMATCGAGAVVSEFAQSLVNPKRVFDIQDIYCNVGGVVLALVLLWTQWRRSKRRVVQELELGEFDIVEEAPGE